MGKKFYPKNGQWFINLMETYEDVKIIRAYENPKDENRLSGGFYVKPSSGKKAEWVVKRIGEFSQPLFPSMQFLRERDGLEIEIDLYERVGKKIEEMLISKGCYENTIEDTLLTLTKQGENKEDCEAIIKVLFAEGLRYKYKRLKSGEYIAFSQLKADAEKSKLYYGSLAEEIKLKSEKIDLLVSHGQTVGNYREFILRNLLKKCIPTKFGVATGFIEGLSRQIDIIVYDSLNHAPTFVEGDLVVVRREAVRAIIEVKSTLATKDLKEALQFFYDLTRPGIYKPDLPIFKGIYAFKSPYTDTNSIAKCIREFYTEPYFDEQMQENMTRDIMYLHHEVSCVTVLDKHCLFTQYMPANGNESDNIIPVSVSVSDERKIDIQSAMFIALLFDYFDVDYNAKKSTLKAFSKLSRSSTAELKIEAKLTDDEWFPRLRSQGEHDSSQASIKRRLEKIDEWVNGTINSTQFLADIEQDAENQRDTEADKSK